MEQSEHEYLERDLAILREAIKPSPDLVRRVASVTNHENTRYQYQKRSVLGRWPVLIINFFLQNMKKYTAYLIPIAAIIVLVLVVAGQYDRSADETLAISADEIITALANDVQFEQSFAEGLDGELTFAGDDRAQWDLFATAYNANEY